MKILVLRFYCFNWSLVWGFPGAFVIFYMQEKKLKEKNWSPGMYFPNYTYKRLFKIIQNKMRGAENLNGQMCQTWQTDINNCVVKYDKHVAF